LDRVSFDLSRGEIKALIGPNGAGKTTLFNVISGELIPDSGSVFFLGENITRMPSYRRAVAGLVRTYQKNNLFFSLSLLENLLIAFEGGVSPFKALGRMKVGEKHYYNVKRLLDGWGLWSKREYRVCDLSYGEQRQTEIILAFASKPKIFLFDEPSAGMSSAETGMIVQMIKALASEISVLIIEHDMDVVFGLAHKIAVLNYGNLLLEGSAEQVKADERVQEAYFGKKRA